MNKIISETQSINDNILDWSYNNNVFLDHYRVVKICPSGRRDNMCYDTIDTSEPKYSNIIKYLTLQHKNYPFNNSKICQLFKIL